MFFKQAPLIVYFRTYYLNTNYYIITFWSLSLWPLNVFIGELEKNTVWLLNIIFKNRFRTINEPPSNDYITQTYLNIPKVKLLCFNFSVFTILVTIFIFLSVFNLNTQNSSISDT